MDALDCPACRRSHREPAEAGLGLRVLCFDCWFEAEQLAAPAAAAARRAA